MSEPTPTSKVGPHWKAGQKWRVEYLRTVPSTVMGPVTRPAAPQRSVWRYEVMPVATAGDKPIVISLAEEDGDRRYEMAFDSGDLTLRSIIRIDGKSREEVGQTVPHEPFFGWTQAQRAIFDWPLFSAAAAMKAHKFKTAEDLEVEQTAKDLAGGAIQVLLKHTDEDDHETTTSRQTWAADSPWWTSAAVEVEYVDGKNKETVVQIKGRLIPQGE